MSIEAFRKFIEKYGVYVFLVMLVAFIVSFASMGGRAAFGGKSDTPTVQGNPIASIDKFDATDSEVRAIVAEQAGQGQTPFTPLDEAQAYMRVTYNVIDHLYKLALASEKGVTMDDNAVKEAIPSLWAAQLDTFKQILISENKLKPTDGPKEFADAFQKETQYSHGMTLDQARDNFTQQFNEAFAQPTRTELMRAEIAYEQLGVKYATQSSLTEDELKNSFNTFNVQQITFVGKTGDEGQLLGQKALADIKGGMKFEDAITKYSTDKPLAGKKLTDVTPINSVSLQNFAPFRPLLDLKAGEMSAPIDNGQSTIIYKIVSITQDPTNGYATKKDDVRKTMETAQAQTSMAADLAAMKKAGKLVWKSPAYKAMYDLADGTQASPDQAAATAKSVEAAAEAALQSDSSNGDVAALANYLANTMIWNTAKPADKKELTAGRLTAIEQVLKATENADLRIELAGMYLDAGRVKDAVTQYGLAAKNNQGTDESNLRTYEMILARIDKLVDQKKVSDTDAQPILDSLAAWRQQMLQEQQFKVDAAKEEAKQAAENEKEMAKQAAAQKAKDDAAKAAAAKAAAGKPTTPPATTAGTTGGAAKPATTSGLSLPPTTATTAATTGK